MSLEDLAHRRESLHSGHASQRALSEDYDLVGLAGEQAFAAATGLDVDVAERPAGDRGVDFTVALTIDVKTARKPYYLIVEQGKVAAAVYVLARYVDDGPAQMLGWAFGVEVLTWPVRDFGYGVLNHYRPADQLRGMAPLLSLINRLRKESP